MLQPSFVLATKANQLVGSAVQSSTPYLIVVDSTVRDAWIASGDGTDVDKLPGGFDGSSLGLAKVAAISLTLTGSTAITIDLTAIAAATGVLVAGATSFSTWDYIAFTNTGSVALAISPGASNPLRTQLGGTSPTMTLQAGDNQLWQASAGLTVDSTHKTLTVTPTSGGSMTIWIGGA